MTSSLPPRIRYERLNSKQKEIFNFQKVAALLADFGFNSIKLADDWQGADFLAYHFNDAHTRKVQLKSRLVIAKKYLGKSLWMAFPIGARWYLVEHDALVDLCGTHTNWLSSPSWRFGGAYSSANPSRGLRAVLAAFALNA